MFGMTVMKNQQDKLVPMRIQNSWQVCIDYRRLNQETRKDHFPLPFIHQVLKKLLGKSHYCFLDGFSRYMQIHIAPEDQHRPPSLAHLCMKVFMDEFTVYADSFNACLQNQSKVLTRCIDTNLVLN
ncbi:hypothetical protein CR513_36934, partial [Mucuna pruriens]